MANVSPNFTFLKNNVPNQRVNLLQGGTRSSKTFSTIYYIIYLCNKHKNAGMEIGICRDTFTALRATAWKDFKNVLLTHGLYNVNDHNRSEHTYTLFGNLISYYGADDPAKIHGRKNDILWINEAHQFPEETVDQLFPRTEHRIIADYNPALGVDHWLDKYIPKFPPCITTYLDNPYLTKAQIDDIESRKDNPYWWQVYGTGQRARPMGAIFTNWERGIYQVVGPEIYGQDFGFSKDPTVLVKISVDKRNKVAYAKELYRKTQLSTGQIGELNREYAGNGLIVADSAEPRLIEELRRSPHNLNVKACKKGPGSVTARITSMQDYKWIIEGIELEKEFTNYQWHDKRAAIPIDDWNHGIDAIAYAYVDLVAAPSGSRFTVGRVK